MAAAVAGSPVRLVDSADMARAVVRSLGCVSAPDSEMPARNKPFAAGAPISAHTAPPPADCSATVTRSGSPPNEEILSRTHFSAAIQSRTPRLSGASSRCRNPSIPSRYPMDTTTTPSRLNAAPSYQGLAEQPATNPPP